MGNNETIRLTGSRLTWGVGIDDYSINIEGTGICLVIIMTSDYLECKPPQKVPEIQMAKNYKDCQTDACAQIMVSPILSLFCFNTRLGQVNIRSVREYIKSMQKIEKNVKY